MLDINHYREFLRRAARDHGGWIFGLNPYNSSITPVLEAIETYWDTLMLREFVRIEEALDGMPASRKRKYRDACDYLRRILREQRRSADMISMKMRVLNNDFNVRSDLAWYTKFLGRRFREKLNSLGPGDAWLDGGAGNAQAIRDYLRSGGEAYCIATAKGIPTDAATDVADALATYDNFEYVSGEFFGEVPNYRFGEGNGTISLITDFNGVLYYTNDFVGDLQKYLELLRPGGELYFTTSTVWVYPARMRGGRPNIREGLRNFPTMLDAFRGAKFEHVVDGTADCIRAVRTSGRAVAPDVLTTEFESIPGQNAPIRRIYLARDVI